MMTPAELKTFRRQRRWTQGELARRLEISVSRLKDYELGHTRTTPPRPAPIPKMIELALQEIERVTRPLSTEEKLSLWYADRLWIGPQAGPPADFSRAAFYDINGRGW
jgi:transcriptional regulator with XRE-family HTH domain